MTHDQYHCRMVIIGGPITKPTHNIKTDILWYALYALILILNHYFSNMALTIPLMVDLLRVSAMCLVIPMFVYNVTEMSA